MNKTFLKSLLTILFTLALIPIIGGFSSIYADSQTSYSSSTKYQVAKIDDNGDFEIKGEYDDFNQAKSVMQTSKNYVVRCRDGYSPTKIVAMNSGLVYSYPRGTSNTQDIYEAWDSNKYNRTITYVERRYEMTYVDTAYMSSKSGFEGQGYVEVILNGFDGFADVEYTDLIPSKYIDNGIGIYVGGPYSGNSNSAVKTVIVPNYYVINRNGNYNDLEFHYHQDYPNSKGVAQEYTLVVDNAVNYTFMNPGTHYFSDDGYNFYTDYKKTNLVGTCYNYYQFLPIRTKTKIPASTLDAFLRSMRSDYSSSAINGKGYAFINNGDEYGCNGVLIYALACQESAYGTSGYAINRNNLFGWSAFDDSPNDATYFSSVDNAIREHMGRNLRKYADYTDSRYNGTYVGNKGSGFNLKYASDPYWGIKIASIYYKIDKFNNNNNGNLTDHNSWNLGLIKNFGAGIYSNEGLTSKICNANYTSTRQVANIVVVNEDEGNCYKIQFSNPINKENRQVYANQEGVIGYSWSGSYAYVRTSDIQLLNSNTSNTEIAKKEYTHDAIASIDNVSLNENEISISGIGAITNVNFTDQVSIEHTVNIIDLNTKQTILTIDAGKYDTNGFSMNDGFNYKYAGYRFDLDLSSLDIGTYYATLTTKCDDLSYTTTLRTTDLDFRNISSKDDNLTYRFSANQDYAYRIELDILKTSLNYSSIIKPSKRSSMNQFDSLVINDDGTIDFSGYSMIYYTNYRSADDDRYSLVLVDSTTGIEKEYKLENIEIDDVIKEQINSVYDISYIGFSKTIDLKELAVGNYCLILKVSTSDNSNSYYDLIEFDASDRILPERTIENINYEFEMNGVRNRLFINVSEVN